MVGLCQSEKHQGQACHLRLAQDSIYMHPADRTASALGSSWTGFVNGPSSFSAAQLQPHEP